MNAVIRPTIMIFAALTLITGLAYPLAVTGISQVVFPSKANGSLIESGGRTVGSSLIGQPFSDPKYLWSRLSATGTFPYNAASSSGSNLGPLNPALKKAAAERVAALREADPQNTAPIPADLVTASASGLDPHISPKAAAYQVPRIARARGVDEGAVRAVVARCTQGPQYGFLGDARVNVLCVNLALGDIISNNHR